MSTWGGLGGWPSGGGEGGKVAKYVVEMGWPMNAVARRLGILLIFFPPHAPSAGGRGEAGGGGGDGGGRATRTLAHA